MMRLYILVCLGIGVLNCLASKDQLEVRTVTQEQLDAAIENAFQTLEERKRLLSTAKGRYLSTNSSNYNEETRLLIQQTANNLAKTVGLKEIVEFKISEKQLQKSQLKERCAPVKCRFSRYRSFDGTCNNFRFPLHGATGTKQTRLIRGTFYYGNGHRRSIIRHLPLSSARKVSAGFTSPRMNPSKSITQMLIHWGAFLAHDMVLTPTFSELLYEGAPAITCCTPDGKHKRKQDFRCAPISIPPGDAMSPRTCLEFIRSTPAPTSTCRRMIPDLPHLSNRRSCPCARDFVNEVTSWIDASHVYGSDLNTANALRTHQDGLLKCTISDTEDFLPVLRGRFIAGDNRPNVQPGLTMLHTVFVRLHNQIARQARVIQPRMSDETLYQETRRIVGALMQHITYTEFLPPILGSYYMTHIQFQLNSLKKGYETRYNYRKNPAIFIEFSTAALRSAHSLIPSHLSLVDEKFDRSSSLRLRDVFGQAVRHLLKERQIDKIARGGGQDPVESMDTCFSEEITDHLFGNQDLIARNIQRGRDHGLTPHYVASRKYYRYYYNWGSFIRSIGRNGQYYHLLRRIYRHVYDIDLYVGGLLERPVADSLLGNTFSQIIVRQFHQVKYSDRFWYENRGQFTLAQLDNIRKIRLSTLLCNTLQLESIRQNVFSTRSQFLSCNELPGLDINLFFKPH